MDALSALAEKHKTDKGLWHHGYTPTYHKYFSPMRNDVVTLLEIGVGGYEYADKGGESLRMWRDYFPNGNIYGIDIHEKNVTGDRIKVFKGSQTDEGFLRSVINNILSVSNIIIDDGSHVNMDTIVTFNILFPLLKSGDIYVVEDTETSYWDENYGGSKDPHAATAMNYFKRLCDTLNPESEFTIGCAIESIHFYKGLIFILKK